MIKHKKTLCLILAIVALTSFPVLVLGSETKLISAGETTKDNTLDKSTCMIELGSMGVLGIVGSLIIRNKVKKELSEEE